MNAVQYIILASPETTPMSHGKAAAQAAHASVEGYRLTDPTSNLYKDWYVGGHHTKIVLQADDVVNAKMYLENRGIKCALIIDEGRTEFDADLTPTAVGCALTNKDNPHIQATFSAFKLYRVAPPRPEPDQTEPLKRRSWRCRVGLHSEKGHRADKVWCLRCGVTWQERYDGISPFLKRRRDLKYGSDANDN